MADLNFGWQILTLKSKGGSGEVVWPGTVLAPDYLHAHGPSSYV